MSILQRCNEHGHFEPCMECALRAGWQAHGGKGEVPAIWKDRASKMAEGKLDPISIQKYYDNEVIRWTLESYGWRAVLNDNIDIQLRDDTVMLTNYGAVIFMEKVSGTEIEQKAAALALVTHYLTGLIARLAFVTG